MNGSNENKKNTATTAHQSIHEELGKLDHDTKVTLLMTSGHVIKGKFIGVSYKGVVSILTYKKDEEQTFENEKIMTTHTYFICALSRAVS